MKRSMMGWMVLGLMVMATGCAVEDGAEGTTGLCAEASEHLAACFGQEVGLLPTTCNEAEAQRILSAGCDTLVADQGKADAWWCTPWTPPWVAGCGGDGGSSAGQPDRALVGNVDYSWDSLGSAVSSVSCALVVVTDANGDEVARAHTGVSGGFAVEGPLPEGDYTLTVYDRHGEDEENVALLVGARLARKTVTFDGRQTARANFTLAYHRDGEDPNFGQGPTSQEAVGRCADVRHTLAVTNACGEELAPYFDVRRDWVVTLTDANGDVVDRSTPMCQPASGDHWSWDGCGRGEPGDDVILNAFNTILPGSYTVTFTRVDLPDRNNLDLDDELGWRRSEEAEGAISFSFQATPEGKVIDLDALMGGPLTVADPWMDCQ